MPEDLPRMYTDLADWFHLITAPDEYVEEAGFYLKTITEASDRPPRCSNSVQAGATMPSTTNAPDHIREKFSQTQAQTGATDSGGRDGEGRAIRWLEWAYDPDPCDDTYTVDYAYILHEDGQASRVIHDRHTCGLFTRAAWLEHLTSAGFEQARALPFHHSELAPGSLEVFVARRPS